MSGPRRSGTDSAAELRARGPPVREGDPQEFSRTLNSAAGGQASDIEHDISYQPAAGTRTRPPVKQLGFDRDLTLPTRADLIHPSGRASPEARSGPRCGRDE